MEEDGYSRLVYLQCATNNKATTVYEQFLKVVQQYHLPFRVHSDQDTENILVARHDWRGILRHSMITGASTHNQEVMVWHAQVSYNSILQIILLHGTQWFAWSPKWAPYLSSKDFQDIAAFYTAFGTITLSIQLATRLLQLFSWCSFATAGRSWFFWGCWRLMVSIAMDLFLQKIEFLKAHLIFQTVI